MKRYTAGSSMVKTNDQKKQKDASNWTRFDRAPKRITVNGKEAIML